MLPHHVIVTKIKYNMKALTTSEPILIIISVPQSKIWPNHDAADNKTTLVETSTALEICVSSNNVGSFGKLRILRKFMYVTSHCVTPNAKQLQFLCRCLSFFGRGHWVISAPGYRLIQTEESILDWLSIWDWMYKLRDMLLNSISVASRLQRSRKLINLHNWSINVCPVTIGSASISDRYLLLSYYIRSYHLRNKLSVCDTLHYSANDSPRVLKEKALQINQKLSSNYMEWPMLRVL